MTAEELKAAIESKKIEAFDFVRGAMRLEPKLTGHKSHQEMALDVINATASDIEKLIRRWERANPMKD